MRWAGIVWLALSACFLEAVELEGKACPCADGFVCDLPTRTCRRAEAVPDAGAVDSGVRIPCDNDRECGPPNAVCVSGFCRAGCAAGGCVAPAVCDEVSGHCLVDGPCTRNGDCAPPASLCIGGRCGASCTVSTAPCRFDRVCNPTSGVCEAPPNCAEDNECPEGYWCDGLGCRRRCTEPGAPPCRGDSRCNAETGRCDGAADLGETCTGDLGCVSGDCLPIIAGGTTVRVCSQTCAATSDCRRGTGCVPVSSAGQCLPASLLGDNPLTEPSGGACDGQTNSCQSTLCEATTCVERCSRAGDCASFPETTCVAVPQDIGLGRRVIIARCAQPFVGAAVGESCMSNLDCGNGVCDSQSATCARLCCGEADCGSEQNCVPIGIEESVLKVCRSAATAGSRPLGGSCATDGECASSVCDPADPANPNGARICTSYCCNDADCDVLPGATRCVTSLGPIGLNFTGRCVLR